MLFNQHIDIYYAFIHEDENVNYVAYCSTE